MKKYFLPLIAATTTCTSALIGSESANIGIVNFSSCVTDSKLGKQEQASFEALKKQMSTLLEETEKQLNDISSKFNDQEYMDGLSPEAEEEMKNKFRSLSEEMNRYQNQYYQVLQQANMRIIQNVSNNVAAAAEKVAKDNKLNIIANKDAFFFYAPGLEVTSSVVAEMDKTYDATNKAQTAPDTAAAPTTQGDKQ